MSEFYTELLVKRNQGAREKLIKAFLIVMSLLSLTSVFVYTFGILIATAFIVFTVYEFIKMDVEYEYLYYNGELDVDIIYHKMKRKNVFSTNLNEMEILAPANSIEVKHYDRLKTFDYSSGKRDSNKYVMVIVKNGQKSRIVFEPNEKMVEDMFYKAPRKVVRK